MYLWNKIYVLIPVHSLRVRTVHVVLEVARGQYYLCAKSEVIQYRPQHYLDFIQLKVPICLATEHITFRLGRDLLLRNSVTIGDVTRKTFTIPV